VVAKSNADDETTLFVFSGNKKRADKEEFSCYSRMEYNKDQSLILLYLYIRFNKTSNDDVTVVVK